MSTDVRAALKASMEALTEGEPNLSEDMTGELLSDAMTETFCDQEPELQLVAEAVNSAAEGEVLANQMELLADTAEETLTRGEVTQSSAESLMVSIEMLLSPWDLNLTTFSMEKHGDNYETYTKVSMEGLRELATRLRQNLGNYFKSVRDNFAAWGKDMNGRMAQVERRSREAKKFLAEKKPMLKDTGAVLSLGNKDLRFRVHGDLSKDLAGDFDKTAKIVLFYLNEYPLKIKATYDQLTSALKATKLETDADVQKLFDKVKGIANPAREVDQAHLDGTPLLGDYGYSRKEGVFLRGMPIGPLGQKVNINLVQEVFTAMDRSNPIGLVLGSPVVDLIAGKQTHTLDAAALDRLMDNVAKTARAIANSQRAILQAADSGAAFAIEFARTLEQGRENLSGKARRQLQAIQAVGGLLSSQLSNPHKSTSSYATTTMMNMINLVEQLTRKIG